MSGRPEGYGEWWAAQEARDKASARRLARLVWCVAAVEVWLFASWAIANWLLSLVGKLPQWLDSAIRLGFSAVYRDDSLESEDMQIVAITAFILAVLGALGGLEAWFTRLVWKRFSQRWT